MDSLDPAEFCEQTLTAQLFLASTYDSVAALYSSMEIIEHHRMDGYDEPWGNSMEFWSEGVEPVEDLVRATILFTGAGMDASIKRLVKDCLPHIIDICPSANEKLAKSVQGILEGNNSTAKLTQYILASDSRQEVINDYINSLLAGSLQSVNKLQKILGSLGLNVKELRQEVNDLSLFFTARNQISHELDLLEAKNIYEKTRRHRDSQEVEKMIHKCLNTTQRIINGVAVKVLNDKA